MSATARILRALLGIALAVSGLLSGGTEGAVYIVAAVIVAEGGRIEYAIRERGRS